MSIKDIKFHCFILDITIYRMETVFVVGVLTKDRFYKIYIDEYTFMKAFKKIDFI